MEKYNALLDSDFKNGYIDEDTIKERRLENGQILKYRYMHGGFKNTGIKFTFSFPAKEAYEGRFYQYLSPFPGPDEEMASLPVLGIDDKIGFCITHGAYYVESNMGSTKAFVNHPDKTMTHRASAMTAEFSRIQAQKVYGYNHRPYGYVYGGSGGGYRTIACIENTCAFDGAVPYVIGSPYAIPNCQTTRAHAERILRHKISNIIDAVDAGGSGDPYESLNEEEAEALKEITTFGFPLKSWFANADMNDGALPVLSPGVKAMDSDYFNDFWSKKGYLGTETNSSAIRDRIHFESRIKHIYIPNKKDKSAEIDTRNGVNDAWKKNFAAECFAEEPWLELENSPDNINLYCKGTFANMTNNKGEQVCFSVKRFEDNRMFIAPSFGMQDFDDALESIIEGEIVLVDNSDYIAIQTYHRHQVPDKEFKAWDQFRDNNAEPIYPQRPILVGPQFCGNGPGCEQNGEVDCKIIIVAALMDEQAYPWQADWYRKKVQSVRGGDDGQYLRLWYFDNCLHDDITASANELYATTYIAGLKQALIDLAAWVEKGEEPVPSTNYEVDGGIIKVPATAEERGGIQPVVELYANGSKCAHVSVGEEVEFVADATVPNDAGKLTFVEYSFEGDTAFAKKGKFEYTDDASCGVSKIKHVFKNPGTYFVVVRVKSERNGDKNQLYTQVRNIDRVRVIVS